jgi:hypothetical protein
MRGRVRTFVERLLIAMFVAAIVLPLAGHLLPRAGAFASSENRRPADFPTIDLGGPGWRWSLASFPRRFERWWNDSFAFRFWLIRANSLAKLAIGSSPSPKAIVGRDGWLFYAAERSTDYYRNTSPFTARELARWRDDLAERKAWLAQRGIRYLVVVAPNKESIYPEYMPAALAPVQTGSRLDQLVAELAREPAIDVLDLRPALREARTSQRLYHVTDTHWNDAGAVVANRAILSRLRAWFPEIDPDGVAGRLDVQRGRGGDLARLIALDDRFLEDRIVFVSNAPPLPPPSTGRASTSADLVVRRCGECQGPVVVMNHDSFGEALAPLLQPHFPRLFLVAGTALDRPLIERERPRVVIQQFVERILMCADLRSC